MVVCTAAIYGFCCGNAGPFQRRKRYRDARPRASLFAAVSSGQITAELHRHCDSALIRLMKLCDLARFAGDVLSFASQKRHRSRHASLLFASGMGNCTIALQTNKTHRNGI